MGSAWLPLPPNPTWSTQKTCPLSLPSIASRKGGCRAASATRSHTEIASRPVLGGANGRLKSDATGPALCILTDCCPSCFWVLSNWITTPP